MEKKLYKSAKDKKLDGVCAGIAEYFDMDPTLIRLLWVIVTVFAGAGLIAYIVCAIVMPRDPGVIEGEATPVEPTQPEAPTESTESAAPNE